MQLLTPEQHFMIWNKQKTPVYLNNTTTRGIHTYMLINMHKWSIFNLLYELRKALFCALSWAYQTSKSVLQACAWICNLVCKMY